MKCTIKGTIIYMFKCRRGKGFHVNSMEGFLSIFCLWIPAEVPADLRGQHQMAGVSTTARITASSNDGYHHL
jgi:hypothetical protein